MLRFREFVNECGDAPPFVTVEKNKVDLTKVATRNEINQTLAATLSSTFTNPYGGWTKVEKVLSMYNIALPRVYFDNEVDGEEVIPIHQFGHVVGADLTGHVSPPQQTPEAEYFLYYSFEMGDSGFYETMAFVVNETELNSILEDDEADEEQE